MDWYQLGVLLFELLVGHSPFQCSDMAMQWDLIMDANWDFPKVGACWRCVVLCRAHTRAIAVLSCDQEPRLSREAKALIRSLLIPDPRKRLGVDGADAIKVGAPVVVAVVPRCVMAPDAVPFRATRSLRRTIGINCCASRCVCG